MKKLVIILRTITFILSVLFILGMSCSNVASGANSNMIAREVYPSLAPMLEKVIPSVISIKVEGNKIVHRSLLPHPFQPFFGDNSPFCQENSPLRNSPFCRFNSESNRTIETFRALGSGVIVNAEKGYAVTNNHVVEHAGKIEVELSDGRRYEAHVIGKDPRSDIALIKLSNANNLSAIKIANSDSLRVGDYTVAIGNPYGLGETVTSGIISALGRSGLNIEHYENFIQTDAAINRGNSGGALVNLHGELIGINTAILAPDGGNIGIGFAIPGNIVKNLVKQIVEFGQVKRGELGIIGIELNSDLADIMKINVQKGAFITQVEPNSSAFAAGIKSGDVIISFNKKPISSFASLRAEIGSLPITTKMELGIFRKGNIKNIILALKKSVSDDLNAEKIYFGMLGLELKNVIFHEKSVIKVIHVKLHTPAWKMGFKKHDIIVGLNEKLVNNLDQLKMVLDTQPKILVFIVNRNNNTIYLVSE